MRDILFTNFRKAKLILFFALFAPTLVFCQTITITGKVIDNATKETLPGVNIFNTVSKSGTITDFEGNFSIISEKGNILKISFVGYTSQDIEVKDETPLSISLKSDIESLKELVVTGYTTQRKSDLTGSVSVVDLDEVKDLPSGNIMKNIQGRLPGVDITTDGSPGSSATIRIRGTGTLNNNDPLYVIDGVPTTGGMQELNPNDIESVQVLKDASSASIYGSRAANGVIIITTKQAREKGVKVDLDINFSTQQYTSKLSPLNTQERGLVYFQAAVNDRLTPSSPIYNYTWNKDYNKPILGSITTNEYLDAAKTMIPADTKWFDEISRISFLKNINLSVAKGAEDSRSLFSVGYYDHDGIVKGTNFTRFNTRFNSEYSFFNNKVKVGQNFTISYQTETQINAGEVQFTSLVQHPIVPVHTINGGWGGPASGMTDRQNPVRLIEDNLHNAYKFIRPFGNAYIEIKPVKNLTLKSNFGIDYKLFYLRELNKSYTSGFLTEPDARIKNQVNIGGNYVWSNTATYNLEHKKHRTNFLAGFERVMYNNEYFDASRKGYLVENLDYGHLNSGQTDQINSGNGDVSALQSFFGKIDYSYNYKYLASVTIRRDGSSKFGINNQYGNFPSVSLGWWLTKEAFMQNLTDLIPLTMKLRASWGQNGNQSIPSLARYSTYTAIYGKEDPIWDNPNPPDYIPKFGTAYDISGLDQGQLPSGYILTQLENPDLKWETTTQTNLGMDITLFENLSGSVDYFNKRTDDILYAKKIIDAAAGESGFQYVNGGSVENSGYEFLLSYNNQLGDFTYDISANMSFIRNEIIEMPEEMQIRMPLSNIIPNEAKTILPSALTIGHSVNSIYGYQADGLFQNQEEVDNYANQPGKGIGRIKYRDLSGPEGKPDNVIDDYDQGFIAVADPDFSYGFNVLLGYKHFTFSMFLQGIQGIEVYNSYKTYTDFASLWPGTNWGTRTLDAWSQDNATSSIPRLTTIDSNNEGRLSSYFIENGSYMKLRNIQLSYNIPHKTLEKLKLKSASIYIQGQNLVTFKSKDFTGPDPENPSFAFPIPAVYTIGAKLSF